MLNNYSFCYLKKKLNKDLTKSNYIQKFYQYLQNQKLFFLKEMLKHKANDNNQNLHDIFELQTLVSLVQ